MSTLETPRLDFVRNGRKQPMVTPPGGDKRVPYSRATSYISVLEDETNFKKRDQRFLARGLAANPHLLEDIKGIADEDDATQKRQLNVLIDHVKNEAGVWAKAELGTYLHSLAERVNHGYDLGTVPTEYLADLAAYTTAMEPFKKLYMEHPVVLDTLRIGGTPDLIVQHEGKRYIADLKTGSLNFGYLKIAMQLAVYSRSVLYNPQTEARDYHDADMTKGLVIHLPAGQGTCELVWVDLVAGWHAVNVATKVREKRALKYDDIVTPFDGPAPVALVEPSLEDRITACVTPEDVRALWNDSWTPDQIALAKHHVSKLQVAS